MTGAVRRWTAGPTWTGRVRPYLAMLSAGRRTATAYPAALAAAAAGAALTMVVVVSLWSAVFAGRGGAETGGYTAREMSTYLVAANLLAVLLANQVDERLAGEVYRGDHVVGMVRPVGYLSTHTALAIPYVLVRLAVVAVPLGVCAVLLLDLQAPTVGGVLLFVLGAVLGTALAIAVNLLVGMAGFVTANTWGVRYLAGTVQAFLSGQLLALDLLPSPVRGVVEALPFAAMVSTPARLLLGRYDRPLGAVALLLTQAGWLAVLAIAGRLAWRAASAAGTAVGG
jgi:ABC-2 type transport system permease protein